VLLVGFIVRICLAAQSSECQIQNRQCFWSWTANTMGYNVSSCWQPCTILTKPHMQQRCTLPDVERWFLICTHAHPGGRSLPGIAGSNPTWCIYVLSLVSVVCCQVGVYASGWSLVQRSPNECVVYEFNREPAIMRTLWPKRGCSAKWSVDCTHTDSFMCIFSWRKKLETFPVCTCVQSRIWGRIVAQAVRRWPVTAEFRVRSQASPCGICGGLCDTGIGFVTSVSALTSQYKSTNAPYSIT